MNRTIGICLVGPDDLGIWHRTLNLELSTLYQSLINSNIVNERPSLHIINTPEQELKDKLDRPPGLDDRELAVTRKIDLEHHIKDSDLVAVYLTRSNLAVCNWAIGFAQGLDKHLIVLDAMYPSPLTSYHDSSSHHYDYQAVGVGDASQFACDKPIKNSAKAIVSYILKTWNVLELAMIPRGEWTLPTLESFWTICVERHFDFPEKLSGVLAIYGSNVENKNEALREYLVDGMSLGIEYEDEETYRALKEFINQYSTSVVHVFQDKSGIRQIQKYSLSKSQNE